MAQPEESLQISGTGRPLMIGQITNNMGLGRGEVILSKFTITPLIHQEVEHFDIMLRQFFHSDLLLILCCMLLILTYVHAVCNYFLFICRVFSKDSPGIIHEARCASWHYYFSHIRAFSIIICGTVCFREIPVANYGKLWYALRGSSGRISD